MPPPAPDFHHLMNQVRAGSSSAACELVERYGPPVLVAVRRQLHKKLRPKFDSQDFVQDVWTDFFSEIFRKTTFNNPTELTTFLSCLARNKVVDAIRQRLRGHKYNINRELSLETTRVPTQAEAALNQPTPSQAVMREEEWERLIDRQPPIYRRILILYRQGLEMVEIAEDMGISARTVSRVLQKIRCPE